MLNDNWEDKHGINLPDHTSCSNNMALQPPQGLSNYDNLTGSSSKINAATLTCSGSNLQDSKFDSNLHEMIKFLSANYGPMKTPLERGTPEYMKLAEILKQSSVTGRGSSMEELLGGSKQIGSYSKDAVKNNIQNVESAALTEDKSSTCRNNQEKVSSSEQLWEGSLQLSSSVTLSAVTFFKSGEKLVGSIWPDFIEVKGKVRLEAFEKYVQDLPRSRNRGLMVISICWNEGSSNIGLNGMKEVAKGYKKSSKVGFAQLLSGIDLYICPRSDPIITILAKYGFFKGMSVIDDKPDSMIGCVVWRKNRPLNPVGSTSDGKNNPTLSDTQNSPPGFSLKQGAEKKPSPEKSESSQCDGPLTSPMTLPLTNACAEVDRNGASSSVSSDSGNLVSKKRPFEDDDLPEFDFGVGCGKSTIASKPLNSPEKLANSGLTQLPLVTNAVDRNDNNGSLKKLVKKTKLFDDDDMPEWCPPELHNELPSENMTSNFQNLPLRPPCQPPLPPGPPPTPHIQPPPQADTRSPFSYQLFRPPISSQPPVFVRPPPQPLPPPPLPSQPPSSSSGRFNSNQNVVRPPPPPQPLRPPPPPLPSQPPSSSSGRFNSKQDVRPPPQLLRPPPPLPSQPPSSSSGRFNSKQDVRPPPQLLQPPPPGPPPSPSQPPSSSSSRFNSNQVLWHRPSFPSSIGRRPQL